MELRRATLVHQEDFLRRAEFLAVRSVQVWKDNQVEYQHLALSSVPLICDFAFLRLLLCPLGCCCAGCHIVSGLVTRLFFLYRPFSR